MMLEIPTRTDLPAYSEQVELDGKVFNLNLRFNKRFNRWVMDIADSENAEVIHGVVIYTGVPLLVQYYHKANLPLGDFICIDSKGSTDAPGEDELGDRFKLYYLEVE